MKRIFGTVFLVLAAGVLAYGIHAADAKVSGQCSTCHTMHNSQNGVPMAYDAKGNSVAAPNEDLLRSDCVGCHSSTTANETVKSGVIPVVFDTAGYPSTPLAGGNFYYTSLGGSANDSKGHNVAGIAAADSILINGPPGFKTGVAKPDGFIQSGSGWGITSWSGEQLNCAGAQGCHGDRSVENTSSMSAVSGGHHGDDSVIDGTTVVRSYRFLAGIKGVEMNTSGHQWEQDANASYHNGYYGVADRSSTNTISYLCAECHGNFHSKTGGTVTNGLGSPWLRHPTDVSLSLLTDPDYDVYRVDIPVAYAGNDGSAPVTGTASPPDVNGIVMCLSCHRAHGSDQPDLLRFNYTAGTTKAGQDTSKANATGCLVCHAAQR